MNEHDLFRTGIVCTLDIEEGVTILLFTGVEYSRMPWLDWKDECIYYCFLFLSFSEINNL